VLDGTGRRIGRLSCLYVDQHTGEQSFAGVRIGWPGRRRVVLVPLAGADLRRRSITVGCGRRRATSAPSHAVHGSLAAAEEPALFQHYEMDYAVLPGERRLVFRSL
jgi:hypothetical protein